MKLNRKNTTEKLLVLVILYLSILIPIYIFQRDLIYLPSGIYQAPKKIGLNDFEEIQLKTADNLEIISWYHPAEADEKTIIFFHGNAGNITGRAGLLQKMQQAGFGVLALEYRGYSTNQGEPSEKGLYEDARAGINFLINERNIAQEDIIAFGRSLGTAIAAQMAVEFALEALVLVSPFDSMANVAQFHYWYLPAKYLITDKFDSAAKATSIAEKTLIFHGYKDNIVPIELAKKLYKNIKAEKYFYELKGQDHNHIDFDYILKIISEG